MTRRISINRKSLSYFRPKIGRRLHPRIPPPSNHETFILQALTEAQERATKDLAEAESKVAALKAELKTLKGAIKILTPK